MYSSSLFLRQEEDEIPLTEIAPELASDQLPHKEGDRSRRLIDTFPRVSHSHFPIDKPRVRLQYPTASLTTPFLAKPPHFRNEFERSSTTESSIPMPSRPQNRLTATRNVESTLRSLVPSNQSSTASLPTHHHRTQPTNQPTHRLHLHLPLPASNPSPTYRPFSITAYHTRLLTFLPSTYTPKPPALSAVEAARHGWTNVGGLDRLECGTCGVAWVVKAWHGVVGGMQLSEEMRGFWAGEIKMDSK
jgi:hypothetical protein